MKYLQTEEQRALSLHWEGLWACPLLSFFWCMDSKAMPASDILQLEILKDNHSLSILSEIKAERLTRLTRLKAEQTLHKGILERQNFVIWTLSWKIQQQPFVFLKGAAPVARYNRFHKPLSSYPPSREAQPSLSMLRSFCAVFFLLSDPNNHDWIRWLWSQHPQPAKITGNLAVWCIRIWLLNGLHLHD